MANIHSIFRKISPMFRGKRMARFFSTLKPGDATRVIDLGGLAGTWASQPGNFPVVLVNLHPHPTENSRFKNVVGDVLSLPYGDQSFDLAFSNSVIEHLHTWDNQKKFAAEVKRVARQYWVQTPARWFPIEPHLIAPLVHFLPKPMQRHLLRWFTVWGWMQKPTQHEIDAFLAEVRLLSYGEFRSLFPDGEIIRERFFGLTKSYIAVKI